MSDPGETQRLDLDPEEYEEKTSGHRVRITDRNGRRKTYVSEMNVKLTTVLAAAVIAVPNIFGLAWLCYRVNDALEDPWGGQHEFLADEVRSSKDPSHPSMSFQEIRHIQRAVESYK